MTSFNKPDYVLQAIESVVAQSFQDWELWILDNSTDNVTRQILKDSPLLRDRRILLIEHDIDTDTRNKIHPSPWLLNKYYPFANGEFILFLADDDLLEPECLAVCVTHFTLYSAWVVCNFSLKCIATMNPEDLDNQVAFIPARLVLSPEEAMDKLDGGQIMHRKSALNALKPPYFPDTKMLNIAARMDGYFLAKLAKHFPFYPIHKTLSVKRITPISWWQRAEESDTESGIIVKWAS